VVKCLFNAELADLQDGSIKYNVIIFSHGLSGHLHSHTSYAK